jgi:hypothetical protein
MLKTLFALALGIGCLILDSQAATTRPSVAFLGFTEDSDPQFQQNLTNRIQFDLSRDTGLVIFSKDEIAVLFAKRIIARPEITPLDLPNLSKSMGAQYFAFAKLEPLANACKRVWWKPWSLKVNWSQAMHLRVLDAATGMAIFDGPISGQLQEKGFLVGPEIWGRMPPSERDGYMQRMLPLLSMESAKALAKAVKGVKAVNEKATPVEVAVPK